VSARLRFQLALDTAATNTAAAGPALDLEPATTQAAHRIHSVLSDVVQDALKLELRARAAPPCERTALQGRRACRACACSCCSCLVKFAACAALPDHQRWALCVAKAAASGEHDNIPDRSTA